MAELADALDLGSSAVKGVQVQVLFPAPQLFALQSNTWPFVKSLSSAQVSDSFVRLAQPQDLGHYVAIPSLCVRIQTQLLIFKEEQ